MIKYIWSTAPNAKAKISAIGVNWYTAADVLVWYQSSRAEQHKALHLSLEVCQSERQTQSPQGPRAMLWVLLSSYPFTLPLLLSLPFALARSSQLLWLSHNTLFPFNQIQAKTCRAIYRRVVLFYQPVSICGSQKYRGLPGCWRQQCSAAERWGLCGIKGERKRRNDTVRQRKGSIELEDAWHLVSGKIFAWHFSGEMRTFISVGEMQVQNERIMRVPVSCSLI